MVYAVLLETNIIEEHCNRGCLLVNNTLPPIARFLKSEVEKQSINTICPGSSDPVYIVTYYVNWVTTSWTDGKNTPHFFAQETTFAIHGIFSGLSSFS